MYYTQLSIHEKINVKSHLKFNLDKHGEQLMHFVKDTVKYANYSYRNELEFPDRLYLHSKLVHDYYGPDYGSNEQE
jgi:hypothetical protein